MIPLSCYPRYPQRRHWQILKNIPSMEPLEFKSYWDVTYADLGRICGCSEATVKFWFCKGANHRKPREEHKQLLAQAHLFWLYPEEFERLQNLPLPHIEA